MRELERGTAPPGAAPNAGVPNQASPAGASAGERWALAVFGVFTLAAVVGYATFGLHPQWLPADGFARSFYPRSFAVSARLQIVVAAGALFFVLFRRTGFRWIPALVGVSAVSFLSEHLGTGYGVPFGAYEYTGLLGPRFLDRVPMLIPLSWFLTMLPAYALASHRFPDSGDAWRRGALATGLLVAWDLALDPAMSHLAPYWVWESTGPFYGMPWVNLVGWTLTGGILAAVLERLGVRRWALRLSPGWLMAYYGIVLLMPLGMVAAGGLWGAVAATFGALGLLGAILRPASLPRADLVRAGVSAEPGR